MPPEYYAIDQQSLSSHVHYLADDALKGRASNTEGNDQSALYIAEQLASFNILTLPEQKNYLVPFKLKKHSSYIVGNNVIGYKKGTDKANHYIILSAHFDHIGQKGNRIFNGADDNASGVSGLLEIAKTLAAQETKYSFIFLFTDSEEINLSGAKAFTKMFPDIVKQTKVNVNLDMIAGTNTTKQLHIVSYKINKLLNQSNASLFKQLRKKSAVKVKKGFNQSRKSLGRNRNWNIASDHGAFYKLGVPFIYYGVGEHVHYHRPTDNYENLNKKFLWLASNTIYQHLRFLDKHIQ